jgi:penicillin-binding protein 1A
MEDASVLEAVKPQPTEDASASRFHLPARYRWPRRVFMALSGGVALALLAFIIYAANDLPPLSQIENPKASLSTQVISNDGVVLDNFYSEENRVNIRLNDISPYVVNALIATEDARFYRHSGVDSYSMLAIGKRYLTGTTSGGSTITMQLARNLFDAVGTSRTATRKIKEFIVSAILERKYTKQEIIEAYLNTVNIYSNAYGIEMASQRLFGKSARYLTIEEAAVMVAMLKGQGVFDPIRRPDTVVSRRNLVIDLMVKHQFLHPSAVDIDSLKGLPLVTAPQGREHEKGMAAYFRQAVREHMIEWCQTHTKPNGQPYNLYTDGLKIYTTIDSRMQLHAEAAVAEHLSSLQQDFFQHINGREPYRYTPGILTDLMRMSERYRRLKRAGQSEADIKKTFDQPVPMTLFSWSGDIDTTMSPMDSLKYYSKFLETGMVSIDPRTGQVKAWVGGIDFRYFKYDHVALGKRQVGSTFKPFVYATAMQNGRKPCDQMLNQPVTFENVDGNGKSWTPQNADGEFGGYMSLRRALATSTNLITARLMDEVKPANVVRVAQSCGIRSHLDPVPSLCLGTADLSVMELTGAYGTFANHGLHVTPMFITRIEDQKGNVLENFSPKSQQAFDDKIAYLMVELLKGVVDEPGGTASRLRYRFGLRNEIGAKTGTTQNHADGWFVGMTPNLVSGVWVGCSDRRMRFSSMRLGQGASMALPIWALYMKRLYADEDLKLAQARFDRPRGYSVDLSCETGTFADGVSRGEADPSTLRRSTRSDDFSSFE